MKIRDVMLWCTMVYRSTSKLWMGFDMIWPAKIQVGLSECQHIAAFSVRVLWHRMTQVSKNWSQISQHLPLCISWHSQSSWSAKWGWYPTFIHLQQIKQPQKKTREIYILKCPVSKNPGTATFPPPVSRPKRPKRRVPKTCRSPPEPLWDGCPRCPEEGRWAEHPARPTSRVTAEVWIMVSRLMSCIFEMLITWGEKPPLRLTYLHW